MATQPTPAPKIPIARIAPATYRTDQPGLVAAFLASRGYRPQPVNLAERAYLTLDDVAVTIDSEGVITVAGTNPYPTIARLDHEAAKAGAV